MEQPDNNTISMMTDFIEIFRENSEEVEIKSCVATSDEILEVNVLVKDLTPIFLLVIQIPFGCSPGHPALFSSLDNMPNQLEHKAKK